MILRGKDEKRGRKEERKSEKKKERMEIYCLKSALDPVENNGRYYGEKIIVIMIWQQKTGGYSSSLHHELPLMQNSVVLNLKSDLFCFEFQS